SKRDWSSDVCSSDLIFHKTLTARRLRNDDDVLVQQVAQCHLSLRALRLGCDSLNVWVVEDLATSERGPRLSNDSVLFMKVHKLWLTESRVELHLVHCWHNAGFLDEVF